MSLLDLQEVAAILEAAQHELNMLGIKTAVMPNDLPGVEKSFSLVIADSRFALHAAQVALRDGAINAHCDVNAFRAKVEFLETENSASGHQEESSSVSETSVEANIAAQHGKRWSEDDDRNLVASWNKPESEITIAALSTEFGRSKVAIAARLVHLGLVKDRAEAVRIDKRRIFAARRKSFKGY